MKALAPGDVVITPAVDRLSRNPTDVLNIAGEMQRAGAGGLEALTRLGTESLQTHRWRELDSKFQFRATVGGLACLRDTRCGQTAGRMGVRFDLRRR
jgi:hypothetical protein